MLATLFILAALAAGEVAAYEQVEAENYRSLESVYGHLTKSRSALQARERVSLFQEETRVSPLNRGARADTDDRACDLAFDILFLQDATGSFEKDYEVTAAVTLPALKEQMQLLAPNTKYSLVTFRDKPLLRLGELDDHCFRVHGLNVVDPTDLSKTFLSEFPCGGYDVPENQFGAMVAAMQSPKTIPWHTDKTRVGIIFLVTDAEPHFAEDNSHPMSGPLPPFNNGPYDEDKADEFCTERGYPSATVVREILLDERIYLGTAIVRADRPGNALTTWQWFNGYVGYPDGFVQVATDEIGWAEAFVNIVKLIYREHCSGIPTYFPTWTPATATTPAPATTASAEDTRVSPLPPTPGPISTPRPSLPPGTGPVTEPTTTTTTRRTTLPYRTGTETSTTAATATTPAPLTRPEPSVPPLATVATDLPEGNTTDDCNCPSQPEVNPDPCCRRQPEVLLALMNQPDELDLHFHGPWQPEDQAEETSEPE